MATSSPEEQTFLELISVIETAIAYGVNGLCARAIARDLITINQRQSINAAGAQHQQATLFTGMIAQQMNNNPERVMKNFIEILAQEGIYGKLIERIGKYSLKNLGCE